VKDVEITIRKCRSFKGSFDIFQSISYYVRSAQCDMVYLTTFTSRNYPNLYLAHLSLALFAEPLRVDRGILPVGPTKRLTNLAGFSLRVAKITHPYGHFSPFFLKGTNVASFQVNSLIRDLVFDCVSPYVFGAFSPRSKVSVFSSMSGGLAKVGSRHQGWPVGYLPF